MAGRNVVRELKERFRELVENNGLGDEEVKVTVGALTPKQAIGSPARRDFPLLHGREVMIEAQVLGSCGQAFTDSPRDFIGSLNDVIALEMDTNRNRAIFTATLNAVAAHLGIATGTRHCRNEEPEECGREIAKHIMGDSGRVKIGLVGLQPAILDNLVHTFGAEYVRCTDLNTENIGTKKYGVEIRDGMTDTGKMIEWCDIVLVTASAINNNTFDEIREKAEKERKRLIVFGVTGAAAAVLLGLERLCFRPH